MSGIAGRVGEAKPEILDAMLAAIDYRGDALDTYHAAGVALGYRWWRDRPGKSPGIHRDGRYVAACAGTLAPPVASPAVDLVARLCNGPQRTADLDGAFAAAIWGQPATIEFLVKQGADFRALSKQKRNALHFSAEGNNAATAKLLLDKGLDANARDAQGMTPLAIAQSLGGENEDVVQVLKAKTR